MRKVRDETADTIAAISTPIGEAAIGVIRVSGKRSFEIADRVFRSKTGILPSQVESFRALYGHIADPEKDRLLDEVLVLVLKSPRTYTCEDMIEIYGHGGSVSLREILELLIREGARLARPGEFTERAFLNGRIDLSQAEAVLDLIHAKTDASLRCAVEQLGGALSKRVKTFQAELLESLAHLEGAIDFPDEDIEILSERELLGRLSRLYQEMKDLLESASTGIVFREGLTTVITGRPNVGKSSLLNALLHQNRAIVTPIAGTTRDAIEETANIRGIPIRLVDTAGIQETDSQIEVEGIRRSRSYLERADLILLVLDGSEPETHEDETLLHQIEGRPSLCVVNKKDLPQQLNLKRLFDVKNGKRVVNVSAITGEGIAHLEEAISQMVWQGKTFSSEGSLVTNVRHQEALTRAVEALHSAMEHLCHPAPPEIVAVDLREALENVGEIVGEVFTEDLLDKIFSQFCIGK
ncbi:MAG: tRNA uridine-5-carboxymethylaminomethyl(34) synthesis GTPase MnmE [Candidatus Omnitrophica bacterium]|nr:tRNA uridine-5-carboxymethylaminomethyl(34) synthesis GTPase MnmE [Candidatus Omnitrophota bacterium]